MKFLKFLTLAYITLLQTVLQAYHQQKVSWRTTLHRSFTLRLKIDDIKEELEQYLKEREKMQLPAIYLTEDNKQTSGNSPLEMFRPSGWYRDEVEADFKSRADSRIPKILHPLSYIELERHGFKSLVDLVMELGGPHEVGKMIGLNWEEPVEVFQSDESLRPSREETYALDIKGSLFLGGALEEKLSAAENLDLSQLKETLKRKSENDGVDTSKMTRQEAEDYLESRKNIKRKVIAPKRNVEKFSLSTTQKAYFLLILASLSVAFGHATADVIESGRWGSLGKEILQFSQLFADVLGVSTFASVAGSALKAREKNRSLNIWVLKSALGGPAAYAELSSLGVFSEFSNSNSANSAGNKN